jgi:hypothetical protein
LARDETLACCFVLARRACLMRSPHDAAIAATDINSHPPPLRDSSE